MTKDLPEGIDIRCCDCLGPEGLPSLPDGSVDLTVTSPPYFNAREYAQWSSYDAYRTDMCRVLAELLRVTAIGRRLVWNVATVPNGSEGMWAIPQHAVADALEIGWRLRADLVWRKPGNEYQAPLGSYPFPGGILNAFEHEYILVFQKPGTPKYQVTDSNKDESKLTKTHLARYINRSVWDIKPVVKIDGQGKNTLGHSAPYPPELVSACIQLWSYRGELVLDPFEGSGTTAEVCQALGRRHTGFEIHPEHVEIIMRRLRQQRLVL